MRQGGKSRLRSLGEFLSSGGYSILRPRPAPHPFTSQLYTDWSVAMFEIDRLREGLRQIVEGDYPSDAGNAETWAAEILTDSHAVEWQGEPLSRSPHARLSPYRRADGRATGS